MALSSACASASPKAARVRVSASAVVLSRDVSVTPHAPSSGRAVPGLFRQQAVDEAAGEPARVVADFAGGQFGLGAVNDILPNLRSLAGGVHRLAEEARVGRNLDPVAGISATTHVLRTLSGL